MTAGNNSEFGHAVPNPPRPLRRIEPFLASLTSATNAAAGELITVAVAVCAACLVQLNGA